MIQGGEAGTQGQIPPKTLSEAFPGCLGAPELACVQHGVTQGPTQGQVFAQREVVAKRMHVALGVR